MGRETVSICSDCANAVPQLCEWIRIGDTSMITELVSKKCSYGKVSRGRKKHYVINAVIECRNFKKGKLPALGCVL